MDTQDLLIDAFSRVRGIVHRVVDGLTADQLAYRPDTSANSIAWLVWHLARVQDDHVADAAGSAQTWTSSGWVDRFGLPFDPSATGYGQSAAEVASVQVAGELLTGYYDAVADRTDTYVRTLSSGDLERVVDSSWDPPVTLGVRLVSVIADCLEHVGQASYVRGLGERCSFGAAPAGS